MSPCAAIAAVTWAVATAALAQSPEANRTVADGDSVLIDGRTFTITPGKAKVSSGQLATLGARELGAGAIIFRNGDTLYVADQAPIPQSATIYNPTAECQLPLGLRDQAYAAPQVPQLDYERQRQLGLRAEVYVNDPDYAYYRLKKTFNEMWSPTDK
jgi:hypothetical protein